MDACPTLSHLEKRLLWTLYRWQFQAGETLTAIPWFCLEAEHWGEKGLAVRRALNKLCTHKLVAQTETYPPDGVYVTPNGKRVEVVRDIVTMAEVEPSGDGVLVRLPTNMKAVESYELTSTGIEAGQAVIRAGEAFAAMMKSDPETKAAWERTRARLCAFGEAMRQLMNSQEYRAAKDEKRRLWKELADAIRANVQWAGNKLEARSFDRPRSIEDWVHLARIVEIPFETIRAGNLTAAEIFDYAQAWHNRKTIEAKLAADANAVALQQPDAGAGPTRAKGPTRRKHRQRSPGKLTAKQLQAVQAFGNCNGNYARTAAELGVCRATAKQHIEAAYRKLGQKVPKTPMTRALPTDRRGNVSVDRDRRHG